MYMMRWRLHDHLDEIDADLAADDEAAVKAAMARRRNAE
jgi:hypothetical protein